MLRLVYLLKFHSLSSFPGPKLWAVSRLPWAWSVIKGDLWQSLQRLHDDYGPVVRIAPDEIAVSSASVWKDVYAIRPALIKDPRSVTPPLNQANSLFTAEGDTHRRIKGAFINAFTEKALRAQSPIIEDYALQFVDRITIESKSHREGIVDLHKIFGFATFDIVSDLTWGESPAALKQLGDHDWIHRFFLHTQFSTVRNCLSRFSPLDKLVNWFFLRVTSRQRARNAKLTESRVDRRLAVGTSRADFMTPIIGKIDKGGSNHAMTREEVITNGLAVIIAASQLGTIALTEAMHLLLTHPHCFQQVQEEIFNAFNGPGDINVESTKSLCYLDAVINETLRLHHPTPGTMPRIAPQEGVMVADHFVAGGNVISVGLHSILTRPENFVLASEFHPERFLSPSDSRYHSMFDGDCKEAFQPFSTGTRTCVGAK